MKHLLLLLSSFVILHSSFAQSLALDLFDGNNFSQVDVPTGANALLGFDANGLPVRVTAGTGITISGNVITSSGGSGGTWGTIAGTITNQTDLMSLFNLKAPILNPTFTGAVTIPAGGTIYGGMNFFITASGGLVMTDTVDDDLVASAWQIRDEDNALTAEMLTDGTLTATSFVGNGNALTFLNANNLDGALPAINGFLLTDLNASALTSGTLPNARLVSIPNSALANSSITINGSAVSLGGSTTIATGLTIGTTAITGGTSGTLLYDNGGVLGKLTPTGTGSPVLSTSATLVTPALGTPTALVLTNATGLPLSTGVTGTLALTNGGTGEATAAAARIALLPAMAGNGGKFLRANAGATDYELASISGGGDALTSGTLAQFAVTTSIQLRGVLSDESGTGEILTTTGSGASLTGITHTQVAGLGTLATQSATISDYLTTAAAASAYQPLDSDLTSIAALTTTSAGRALLDDADAAAQRTTIGLGTLATQSATISDYLTTAAAASAYQPLDSDLTDLADGSLTGTSVAAASTSARGSVELATDGETVGSVAVQGNDTRLVNAGAVEIGVAISDETTALTTGTAKISFRMPHAMTVTAVRLGLTTVSSSGLPTVDINEGGTTILSTKLTCDASEKTSTTAATAAVISDSALADDAEITIDIDTAGTGATGAKVWLIGTR